MARDFRPRGARGGDREAGSATATAKSKGAKVQASSAPKKTANGARTEQAESNDDDQTDDEEEDGDDSENDEVLLREIKALGGDESDLKLIRGEATGKTADTSDDEVDPALQNELVAFMKGLDYKGAGSAAPSFDLTAATNSKKLEKAQVKAEKAAAREAEAKAKAAKKEEEKVKAERSQRKEAAAKVAEQAISAAKQKQDDAAAPSVQSSFLFHPTPQWSEAELPLLPSVPSTSSTISHTAPSNDAVVRLQRRAESLLASEQTLYSQQMSSGRSAAPGMLSASDARFISQLLAPGARGGTLSDRIAALTLLSQSSPLHNVEAMESLLGMAQKKGREESSRATRALADWLASGGGLSDRKLRYFRDHPSVAQIAALDQRSTASNSKTQKIIDVHLLVAAFEDRLKRFYFDFLKVLETQTHDTLPFMRTSAVTQVFYLLKDKAEQEQNLLRLLVNKLGDADRGVASKASNHILSLLNVHPNMKNVVTVEVSNLVMQAPASGRQDGKASANAHAQYFGILTLNQTMLTDGDEAVAKRLVSLYFSLFEGILQDMTQQADGKEEGAAEVKPKEAPKEKREKGRWRDGHKGHGMGITPKNGKGKKNVKPTDPANTIADADSKVIAAILAGVRRALPFAKIESSVIEKHMDTLFRITHCSTFNIALQALQLIFQVCSAGHGASTSVSTASGLQDRFYRALYASLLDPRLATTSKQAMYLNLMYKAMKADHDDARTKAFVKRLTQLLGNSDPPLICGSLFLIAELFIAKPGLRTLLKDAEDDDEEHFRDAADEESPSGNEDDADKTATSSVVAKMADGKTSPYDGIKREPRYAKAELTCLWEIVPLLSHFHPSVSLCASQILQGERISTSADLTLHTLSHFLDRFVYRNPKKNAATSKGASLMQPAVHASGDSGRVGLEAGVVRLKGAGIRKDEFVNDAKFWRKKAGDVPVDQLFFHKYFNLKLQENEPTAGQEVVADVESASEASEDLQNAEDAISDVGSNDDDEEDSAEEEEIWKAMKATMPREAGDEALDEEDEDDDSDLDAALMESSDEGSDDISDDDDEDGDEEGPGFEEEEDDLMPFSFGGDEAGSDASDSDEIDEEAPGSRKRKAEGDADAPKSKSQQRRADQKKRKAMPTFASADDYAHLLG